nr:SAM-dependent methyltransferase [Paenalcaligenes hominis]
MDASRAVRTSDGLLHGGSTKFHYAGDFTTAPELSPLFGQCLAKQVAQILQHCPEPKVFEFGAGSGALAASVLTTLDQMGHTATPYMILELSPSLRARQQERLASWGQRVQWVNELPAAFSGAVLANEVLDAMPVHLVQRSADLSILELGVSVDHEAVATAPSPFRLSARLAEGELARIAEERLPRIAGYRSEINLQAESWIRAMGDWLQVGGALLIDYGFAQHEYYHAQRTTGTLMCHFRHFAHDESLILPGFQDITAHVDFTAMADAALAAQLEVGGYTSQAHFLMNCGITQDLEAIHHALDLNNNSHLQRWTQQVHAVQTLLSEAEMGELFKVLALGKDLPTPLLGFMMRDRRDFL